MPELNGRKAAVLDYDEQAKEYEVELDNSGNLVLRVSGENLILPKNTLGVRVVGLTEAPQWNEALAKVLQVDSSGHYLLEVCGENSSSSSHLRVKPKNIAL